MKALIASWVASLCMAVVPLHAGGVYYSDRFVGNAAIRACDFGAASPRLLGTASDPRGVVFDAVTGRVFYGDRSSGGQLNSYLAAGGDPRAHASGLANIADLRPERASRRLYWCQENGGLIRSAPFPTTAAPTLTPTTVFSGLSNPYYLDIDPAGERIYWSQSGASIFTLLIFGGSTQPQTLVTTLGGETRGVAVDAVNGQLYWAERTAPGIYRRAIAGGTIQVLYGVGSPTGQAPHTPHGVILDLPARKIYWADTGTNAVAGFNGRGISRGDLDGGNLPEVVVAGTLTNQPWDVDLDPRTLSYAEWRARFFRFDAAAPTIDLLADPDLDGVPNLLEYALGSAPLDGRSTATTLALFVTEVGVEYPAIRFRRRIGAVDLAYSVQTTGTLPNWGTNGLVEIAPAVAAEEGMEVVTVRSTVPRSENEGRFFRVVVQSP